LLSGAYAAAPSSFVFDHPRAMWNLDNAAAPEGQLRRIGLLVANELLRKMNAGRGRIYRNARGSVVAKQPKVNIPGRRA
jgi:hypothetical protein